MTQGMRDQTKPYRYEYTYPDCPSSTIWPVRLQPLANCAALKRRDLSETGVMIGDEARPQQQQRGAPALLVDWVVRGEDLGCLLE